MTYTLPVSLALAIPKRLFHFVISTSTRYLQVQLVSSTLLQHHSSKKVTETSEVPSICRQTILATASVGLGELKDMTVKMVTLMPPPEDVLTDDESSHRSAGAKPMRPIQVTTGDSSMMRRSKSMARLLSEVELQKRSFSLLSMVPDVHSTLELEGEHDEENSGNNDAIAANDVCLNTSLYNWQKVQVQLTNNDPTYSDNRRPSRRASQDGSLKSSLRRSFSLRTSDTSITSNISQDWSRHSMKRFLGRAPSSTKSDTDTDTDRDSNIISGLDRTEDDRAFIKSVLRQDVLFRDVVQEGSHSDLASTFDRVEYKKGEVIFSQGDTDKEFMLILKEGECSITIDGEEIPGIYGTMRPPAMVGELALLMDRERAATVIAKTNVVAFRLDRASFKYFIVKSEDIKAEIRNIDHVIDKISGIKTRYGGDIIRQFKPSRRWLWGRWHGTIFQQAWKVAVAIMLVSACFVAAVRFFCHPTWHLGQIPDPTFPLISRLVPLANLWNYLMTITTFILTFFLSQAYTLWRNVYDSTRRIQGRNLAKILLDPLDNDSDESYDSPVNVDIG